MLGRSQRTRPRERRFALRKNLTRRRASGGNGGGDRRAEHWQRCDTQVPGCGRSAASAHTVIRQSRTHGGMWAFTVVVGDPLAKTRRRGRSWSGIIQSRHSRRAVPMNRSQSRCRGRADVKSGIRRHSRTRAGSGVCRTRCPAVFLAHHPRGGTGMSCRSHNLPSPRPESPSSFASASRPVTYNAALDLP